METSEISGRIPVGISSCLIGEKVRFDGGHKNNAYIVQTLGLFFAFRPFCPEVDIGLGIPREPIRLVERDGQLRCVGTRDPALDVTEALQKLTDAEAATLLAALQRQATEKWGSEKLASFAFSRDGGDAERGRDLFRNHVAAQCSRCHRTGPSGSDIGPELTKIAEKKIKGL